jgi:hypothetical protein
VSGETDDDVEELLQRYDIDDLDIAEEELWMVEAPVLPEPDTPEEAEEGKVGLLFYIILVLCNCSNTLSKSVRDSVPLN